MSFFRACRGLTQRWKNPLEGGHWSRRERPAENISPRGLGKWGRKAKASHAAKKGGKVNKEKTGKKDKKGKKDRRKDKKGTRGPQGEEY